MGTEDAFKAVRPCSSRFYFTLLTQSLQPIEIFEVENKTLQPKKEAESPAQAPKSKTKRKPKTVVSVEKSRSIAAMPQWAQDRWYDELRPTICDRCGESQRPFHLGEGRNNEFVREVQEAVLEVDPMRGDYIASTSCKIYACVSSTSFSFYGLSKLTSLSLRIIVLYN